MKARALAVAAALCALLALPVAAEADSIVYIKDGNVWSAAGDGSRQIQVTNSGGYAYVSQADDGSMIALAPGERLHRLAPDGRVVADFATFVSDGAPVSGPTNRFHGPFEPAISPDGTKVAFEWFNDSYSNGNTGDCNVTNDCYLYTSRKGVGITHSDRLTGHEEFGLLTGWGYPSWIDNDTLLRSYSGAVLNDDTVFNKIGPGKGDDDMDHWFFDDLGGGGTVSNVELSRDQKAVVGILGQSSEKLRVYRPIVDPFNAPDWNHSPFTQTNQRVVQPCYEFGDPIGGKFTSVSIAPDGRHMAYGVGDGIWIADIPDLSADCENARPTDNALRIPGGGYPDWGPADPPTRTVATTGTQQDDPNQNGQNGQDESGVGAGLSVKAARVKLAKALRSGFPVTVKAGGPGKVKVTAKLGRKQVASGSGSTLDSGNGKVTVRFTKAAKKSLRRKRSVKLKLTVSFTPAQGATVRRAAAVTLRR
jgi:hypothetical protein